MPKLRSALVLTLCASCIVIACGDDDAPATNPPVGDAGGASSGTSGTSGAAGTSGSSGTDAGEEGGNPPPVGGLASGDGFAIVYAGNPDVGFDARPNSKATFDAAGHLTSYEASAMEKLALGAATDPSAGGDMFSAWGAWTGGPTTGVFYNSKPQGDFTFEGFHYAIGKQTLASALPTGAVSYTLVGRSAPTFDGTSDKGKLDNASASCTFGTPTTCSFVIGASATAGTYAGTTEAGKLNVGAAGTGQIRVGSVIAVFLGGAGERIGLVYAGKTTDGRALRGSAVLKR